MPTWLVILLSAAAGAAFTALVRMLTDREKAIDHQIETRYGVRDPQFRRSMDALLEPNFLPGNLITPLQNGDEIFPPMLEAIANARRTITFETFIYWSGAIGRKFAEALAERARAGVQVHVVLDWFGSKPMEPELLRMMEDAGIKVERYHALRWYNLRRMNHRTHRKILVVDGLVGFTGGVGIADEWLGDARDETEWRDCHFKIEGPVVAQLQRAFMDNWLKTHSDVLHGDRYFPHLEARGTTEAQVFMSSPEGGSESAHLMFLLSIAAAAEDIRISTAYFVPDELVRRELIAARRRGVRVRIIVPGERIDKRAVRSASRAAWGPLLAAGVEIFEYKPTMYHCKLFIADGVWVSVGSANFDNRSFKLNDESNLNAYDADLAATLSEGFDRDMAAGRQVTYEAWANRPRREKLKERLAALFSGVM